MKPLAILLAITAVAAASATDDIIPKAFSKDRYAETAKKSPFVLETKGTETGPPPVNPFQNLYLRGVGKADGKDYVLVQRLGEERSMRFIGTEPGPDGLAVKTVRLGDNFRETEVVLEKGADTGVVKFKQDTINAPPPAAGGHQIGVPGQFPKPNTALPPQMQSVRPVMPVAPVPRPGTAMPMPMPMPQPTAIHPATIPQPPGNTQRTRIRTINN
ncbi:MAG: hypothetical protein ABI318_04740 [Chthoniobacteraceae bacterium]